MSSARACSVTLRLADGSAWALRSSGGLGEVAVRRIAAAMRLDLDSGSPAPAAHQVWVDEAGTPRRVTAGGAAGAEISLPFPFRPQPAAEGPPTEEAVFVLVNAALRALVILMEPHGILLAHAALIACDGRGVLLAGRGDAGKTTAALRVGAPWTALCDDSVLLVPGQGGACWAHPWPTWSAFLWGGPGASCATCSPVRLAALAFIRQGPALELAPLGRPQTAARLATSASQVAVDDREPLDDPLRASRLHRFATACRVAAEVPGYTLQLTLDGAYWTLLDGALGEPAGPAA